MSTTDDLCRSYLDLKWHFDPAAASAAGLVEHDKRLGSFDAETVRRHLAAVRALAAAVEAADIDTVDEEIDRTALLNELRATGRRFEVEQPQSRNPGFWLSHLFGALYALVARRPDPAGDPHGEAAARAGAAIDRLRAAPGFLDSAAAELDRPPQIFVDSALQMLGGGGELIARMAARLGGDAPEIAPELEAAAGEALQALTSFGRRLASEIEPNDDPQSFAIGEELFERRVQEELALRYSISQLWRYGEQLQAQTEAAIVEVARRIDPAKPWRDVVERVREETPPPEGVLDAYRAEVDRALALLQSHDLVGVPPGPLEVKATPSFLRPLTPFAAYMPPPIYRADRTGDFFVTLPDTATGPAAAALLRAHALAGIPSTVAHETYPGHHLHLLRLRDLGSEVRRHLWTPIMVEGWALYSEELLGDLGYYRRDEERLLQLVNLLWRAVRIELDIALHTRGLAPSAAVQRLVERIPMERAAAEGEVRRYCAMPTYQLSYALGRRELLELREAWRRNAGDSAGLRPFHDAVLGYGGLPPSLARWGMGLG